ncbi:MAG: hypothetical protein NTZ43_01315 [Gemmatimonadetes bacterium]|nr:hypothetical protein [Gemmatimonadota bacterium]
MDRSQERALLWTPRVLGIVYALLVASFALEVFNEPGEMSDKLGSFLIRLSPAVLLGVAVALAWTLENWGGLLYLLVALIYPALHWGSMEWSQLALLSGVPVVIALLCFAHHWLVSHNPPRGGPLTPA